MRCDELQDAFAPTVARLRAAGCVFAEDEARLLIDAAESIEALETMLAQRVAGTPIEYVVGYAEFCGLRIVVTDGVFVPRRRTEFLVRQAAAFVHPGSVVVDLCCGTGAIGAALADSMSDIELHAAEIDGVAVTCARRNLEQFGASVHEGDLLSALPASLRGRVDVLVFNAPYVPTGEIEFLPPEARLHEAPVALDGGDDGTGIQRRVVAEAAAWLAPGGHLLTETSERQAAALVEAVSSSGLVGRIVRDDELDATVVIASFR